MPNLLDEPEDLPYIMSSDEEISESESETEDAVSKALIPEIVNLDRPLVRSEDIEAHNMSVAMDLMSVHRISEKDNKFDT